MNNILIIFAGSVLFQDEINHSQGATGGSGEVVLNLDGVDRDKYQQQLQLIDEQVLGKLKIQSYIIK